MNERRGSSTTIRLAWEVRDALSLAEAEFYAEHRVMPTDSEMVGRLLADRKAWRAMGEAAREVDRKPVPS